MGGIFDIINVPLGYLFKGIYYLVGSSYGWALVLFTIVTKLLLTPLSVKQQKSTMQMQKIQPRLAEIQKKYQYDKEKLNQETLKLYQDNNISPMGGCLPLLIQFPVLISLYSIIRSPLTYIFQVGKDVLTSLAEALNGLGVSVNVADEIGLYSAFQEHIAELGDKFAEIPKNINFSFFGLDLSQVPSLDKFSNFDIIIIIPILAGVTTFLLSYLTQKSTAAQQGDNPAAGSMKMMNYIFPIMTFVFSISLPAGLGFYWILSNLYQMVQHVVMPKFIKLDDEKVEEKPHFRDRENRRKKK